MLIAKVHLAIENLAQRQQVPVFSVVPPFDVCPIGWYDFRIEFLEGQAA